jgi:hypothetical protein
VPTPSWTYHHSRDDALRAAPPPPQPFSIVDVSRRLARASVAEVLALGRSMMATPYANTGHGERKWLI